MTDKTFSAPLPILTRNLTVGQHTIGADSYHADPCERPSLSASIAHILCTKSPAHAAAAHPKLNPNLQRREDEKFDVGNAAHALLLQGDDIAEVIQAENWRTKEAREFRDAARAGERIPLLVGEHGRVRELVDATRYQLREHRARPPLFTDGEPEQTLVWEEPGGVTCRARLDWLRDDVHTIDDLKTTSRSAHPDAYSRALFGVGGDVQAAFYIRGVQELFGATPEFRWVVVETQPPFALSVISPGPDVLAIGAKKVEYAIDAWRRCLAADSWPGYPLEVCTAELPAYEESRWLQRELEEAA